MRPQDIVLLWASPPCEQFSRVQQCRGTLNPIAGDRCVYTVMDFIKCVFLYMPSCIILFSSAVVILCCACCAHADQ